MTKEKMGGPGIDIDGLELGQIIDAQIFRHGQWLGGKNHGNNTILRSAISV